MAEGEAGAELAAWRTRALAYRKIVERYADAVNAGEQKTIPELKALVNAADPAVAELRKKILGEISRTEAGASAEAAVRETGEQGGVESRPPAAEPYRFERDFLAYAERAFSFVQSLRKVQSELSVSFWLSPSEIVELGAADAFDRSILLAALLLAGKCDNARVRVLELEGGNRHPVVVFYYGEKQHLMDASQEASGLTFTGTLEEIFKNYSYEGKKVAKSAFEFNDKEYSELE